MRGCGFGFSVIEDNFSNLHMHSSNVIIRIQTAIGFLYIIYTFLQMFYRHFFFFFFFFFFVVVVVLKTPNSSTTDSFIQVWFNQLIYGISTIIKWGIWQPVTFQLVSFLNWIKNEIIFYRVSELMLATLIQRYDKKIISFQERQTNWNFTGCQVPHFIISISYLNSLNLSWIQKKKKKKKKKNVYFLMTMEPLSSDGQNLVLV